MMMPDAVAEVLIWALIPDLVGDPVFGKGCVCEEALLRTAQ